MYYIVPTCRDRSTAVLADAFSTAAAPQRSSPAREALGNQFPRLAALLESLLARLASDSEVGPFLCCIVNTVRRVAWICDLRLDTMKIRD